MTIISLLDIVDNVNVFRFSTAHASRRVTSEQIVRACIVCIGGMTHVHIIVHGGDFLGE